MQLKDQSLIIYSKVTDGSQDDGLAAFSILFPDDPLKVCINVTVILMHWF